jgi:cell division protein FtsB
LGALLETRIPHFNKRRLLIVGCLVLAVYFTVSGVLNRMDTRSLDREQAAAEQELAELAARKDTLERLRDYLASSEFVMEEARRRLGMVMPGETQIIVVGPEAPPEDATGKSWWEALFDYGDPAATVTPAAP